MYRSARFLLLAGVALGSEGNAAAQSSAGRQPGPGNSAAPSVNTPAGDSSAVGQETGDASPRRKHRRMRSTTGVAPRRQSASPSSPAGEPPSCRVKSNFEPRTNAT